ncbi:hypothetical protein P9222_27795 [Paenibacillus amylolyticus]|nr:hypothetical protein [Paenibacillus amylolyticus]WFR62038.1 hypothetical protein P9222_27795 [Paenibacillus amylolyticus]
MKENDWVKRLEQLYFTAVHIYHFASNPGAVQRRIWKRFAICRVITGKGSLTMDNVVRTVSQDEWFLLKPGMHVEFQTDMEAPSDIRSFYFPAWHLPGIEMLGIAVQLIFLLQASLIFLPTHLIFGR